MLFYERQSNSRADIIAPIPMHVNIYFANGVRSEAGVRLGLRFICRYTWYE